MKILFVEPPKRFWFVMGEYLPPPLGILELAAYVESKMPDTEIEVLDCQASRLEWDGLERHIESTNPDIVASSSLSTCNAYTTARTLATAKKVNPSILTVAGGQHFTATADESLRAYPEIDVIIRGEGELTLVDLAGAVKRSGSFADIEGISHQSRGRVFHNPERQLIANLDELPMPAYHLVEDHARKYHFTMMTGPKRSMRLWRDREAAHTVVRSARSGSIGEVPIGGNRRNESLTSLSSSTGISERSFSGLQMTISRWARQQAHSATR